MDHGGGRPSIHGLKRLLALVFTLTAVVIEARAYSEGQGNAAGGSKYGKVRVPTLDNDDLSDLPGLTRSVFARDHALITPESRVWAPLPGWTHTLGAVLITPAMGAQFTMLLVEMQANATSTAPSVGVERLVFVLEGQLALGTVAGAEARELGSDGFGYIPRDTAHRLTSDAGAYLILIERKYSTPPPSVTKQPTAFTGTLGDLPNLQTPGEVFDLRKLLPPAPEYDFNIHIMDFAPGEYLNVKELHYNQHGLVLLEGRGIYRLGDSWYPVQAGDAIWMAPFVPQWYAALGTTRTRYFLYKDTNRDPLNVY